MGYSVPAAIGAKKARPDAEVLQYAETVVSNANDGTRNNDSA